MAQLVKLFDEKQLLSTMQADTVVLIRDCKSIEPIKLFVKCHEILSLTWDIQEKFPKEWPDDLECDEHALLELLYLTRQLLVGFGPELPRPGFDLFDTNVRRLLRVFRVPRKGFQDVRLEDGTEIKETPSADMSVVQLLVDGARRSEDET